MKIIAALVLALMTSVAYGGHEYRPTYRPPVQRVPAYCPPVQHPVYHAPVYCPPVQHPVYHAPVYCPPVQHPVYIPAPTYRYERRPVYGWQVHIDFNGHVCSSWTIIRFEYVRVCY